MTDGSTIKEPKTEPKIYVRIKITEGGGGLHRLSKLIVHIKIKVEQVKNSV
jgi:hypothetical protein